jgi:hypothetical protein
MNERFDAGALISADTQAVDLGDHDGVQLEGRVVRRRLRIGIGGDRGIRIELTRLRPTSIRAIGPGGDVVHRLPANPDPWLEAAQRLIALTIVSAILPRVLRRRVTVAREGSE